MRFFLTFFLSFNASVSLFIRALDFGFLKPLHSHFLCKIFSHIEATDISVEQIQNCIAHHTPLPVNN